MKLFFSFILFCFSLVFVVSCRSRKPPEPVIVEKVITEKQIQRDTLVVTQTDSAAIKAYIDCVNSKPIIVNQTTTQGRTLKPSIQQQGNEFIFSAEKGKEEIPVKTVEKIRNETVPQIIYKDKIVETEKPFRWYHKVLMWTGGISLLLLAVGLSLKFIKPL